MGIYLRGFWNIRSNRRKVKAKYDLLFYWLRIKVVMKNGATIEHWFLKAIVKFSIQPVPKSAASIELTEPVKGVGDLPIPILNKWS